MDPLFKLTRPKFCFWEFMVSILLKVCNGHLLALRVCWIIIFQTSFLYWVSPLCLSGLCTDLIDGGMHSLHPGVGGVGAGESSFLLGVIMGMDTEHHCRGIHLCKRFEGRTNKDILGTWDPSYIPHGTRSVEINF